MVHCEGQLSSQQLFLGNCHHGIFQPRLPFSIGGDFFHRTKSVRAPPICIHPPHSLHPETKLLDGRAFQRLAVLDRKSTRLKSSHRCIPYAVFSLKKIIRSIIATNRTAPTERKSTRLNSSHRG